MEEAGGKDLLGAMGVGVGVKGWLRKWRRGRVENRYRFF